MSQQRRRSWPQNDRLGEVGDRARVVLEPLLRQPTQLVQLGRWFPLGQEGITRPDDLAVSLQLAQQVETEPVSFRVVGDDLQGGLEGREGFLVAALVVQ